MQPITIQHNSYTITTDKALMQIEEIHKWISEQSYWAKSIPFEKVKLSFENSYCIGLLYEGRQVGYGRLFTDYSTFGYLADVYVEEAHRGKGLGVKMMQILFDLDWVKGLRRIMLATRDAHGLYEKIGFTPLQHPERLMEITRPGIYEKPQI